MKSIMWSLPALTLELDHAPAHQSLKIVLSADKLEKLNVHISWRNLINSVTCESQIQEILT